MTWTCNPLIPPVVGDGKTDDTAAFQAFVNSLPNFSKVVFPFGMKILMTAPLLIGNKMGLSFVSEAGGGGPSANGMQQSGTAIGWKLATAGQPMIQLYGSRSCTFDGLCIVSIPGGANPSIGIDIDVPKGFAGYPSTDNTIRNCYVGGPAVDCGFWGIANSRFSTSNCDYLTIEHTEITVSGVGGSIGVRTGIGFYQGNSFNAKQTILRNVQIGYANYAIKKDNGSMYCENISSEFCNTVFYIGTSGGPDCICGGGAGHENCGCLLEVVTGSNPILCATQRCAGLWGSSCLKIHPSSPSITLIGNSIVPQTAGATKLFDPAYNLNNGISVMSLGNHYGVPSPNLAIAPNFHSMGDFFSAN